MNESTSLGGTPHVTSTTPYGLTVNGSLHTEKPKKTIKTDPRIIQMLAILYSRNYLMMGQDDLFEKLLKGLEEDNDYCTL